MVNHNERMAEVMKFHVSWAFIMKQVPKTLRDFIVAEACVKGVLVDAHEQGDEF